MEFTDLINKRQSVREYSKKEVEADKIEKCLEAARLAPSASNSQPWKLIIVNDAELVKKVAAATFSSVVCLQAAELGLGTCMMGWFDEKTIKKLLGIPKNKRLGLIISLGYAPEDYPLRKKIRKEKTAVLSYNKYELWPISYPTSLIYY